MYDFFSGYSSKYFQLSRVRKDETNLALCLGEVRVLLLLGAISRHRLRSAQHPSARQARGSIMAGYSGYMRAEALYRPRIRRHLGCWPTKATETITRCLRTAID